MKMTAVLWLAMALAVIAFAVLSWRDLTRRPTRPAPPAAATHSIDRERCPSTNGQLRSCEDDEVRFTLPQ